MGRLKYLVPNALTASSLCFSMLGIQAAMAGRPREAAWWVIYCVLVDKLDGIAARALGASSEFGMQLDSLADLVAFGVAPATLLYGFFTAHPELGWSGPLLKILAAGYVICTAVRLARFNLIADASDRVFFGTPSTFAGGTAVTLFQTLLKYGDPSWSESPTADLRYFGGARLDALMPLLPWFLVVGGVAMVSRLRVPKARVTKRLAQDVPILGNLAFCYLIGIAHWLPEHLAVSAVGYFLFSLGYHLLGRADRGLRPPPLFPAGTSAAPSGSSR